MSELSNQFLYFDPTSLFSDNVVLIVCEFFIVAAHGVSLSIACVSLDVEFRLFEQVLVVGLLLPFEGVVTVGFHVQVFEVKFEFFALAMVFNLLVHLFHYRELVDTDTKHINILVPNDMDVFEVSELVLQICQVAIFSQLDPVNI